MQSSYIRTYGMKLERELAGSRTARNQVMTTGRRAGQRRRRRRRRRRGDVGGRRKPLLMHARHRAHRCHQNLQSLRLSQVFEQLLSEIMNKMFSFTSAKDFIELSPLFFLRILEGLWDFVLVTRFEKHFASDKVKNFMH